MIVLTTLNKFKPIKNGRYLVVTKTKHTGIHYFTTNVSIKNDKISIDAHNQEVILISKDTV